MSIAEAALYGDLVKYLRDICALKLADVKGTDAAVERAALDEVIRGWFFAPQDELYGLAPQRVIRNEELGLANTIPSDRLGEVFDDGCPLCAAMLEEAGAGLAEDPHHDHGWSFGLAPDMSLLDEYDPEGYDERWRIEEERMAEDMAERQAEAETLPFIGADDPQLAAAIQRRRSWLDEDIPF